MKGDRAEWKYVQNKLCLYHGRAKSKRMGTKQNTEPITNQIFIENLQNSTDRNYVNQIQFDVPASRLVCVPIFR